MPGFFFGLYPLLLVPVVFSAPIFLFFFLPIVLLLHSVTKGTVRNAVLLISSLFFYAWGELHYVLLMIASIALAYFFGQWIGHTKQRKVPMILALTTHIGILVYFKYFNFLSYNFIQWTGMNYEFEEVHLPIGISFFTFQIISYLMDVSRSDTPPESNPLNLGVYISLFPQLIAGPIVRYTDVMTDLNGRTIQLDDWSNGIRRFITGFAKKILIANPMGYVAELITSNEVESIGTGTAWIGMVAYALHILFDFSGYSDMAIGMGRMMGFKFPENFNYPYIARSVREFWRRWHMTLSFWFRDYLYIPLGGSHHGEPRTFINLIVVFLITGLWHGASWNFVLWGAFHGLFLLLERLGRKLSQKKPPPSLFRHAYLVIVVLTSWVFFSIDDIDTSFSYLKAMYVPQKGIYHILEFMQPKDILIMTIGLVLCIPIQKIVPVLKQKESIITYTMLLVLFVWSSMEMLVGTYDPFIYFRF